MQTMSSDGVEAFDTLTNLVTGLGTEKDKVTHGRFASHRHRHLTVTKAELDAAYETDWLSGTIIDAPCDDMTREWRSWKAGPRQIEAIEGLERSLHVRSVVNRALKMSRLYGGSVILLGMRDADWKRALEPTSVQKGDLQYLHVLSRHEIGSTQLDRDPLSPTFGEPTSYQLQAGSEADIVNIHPSRVVRFLGQARLEFVNSMDGWGLSTLLRVYDAVRNAAAVQGNLASLTHEAKIDVIKVPGLTQNSVSADYRSKVMARFGLANMAKSIQQALILDANEDWSQKQIRFSEFPAVLRLFLEVAAGAANMPVTRLLGTAAKGLNATGDGDLRHYYDTLSSRQEVELRPALERLDEVLIRSAIGSRPAKIWYEFLPLWQLNEAEKGAVSVQKAQVTQIYAELGVMPKDALVKAVQGQLCDDGTYPGLEAILEASGDQKPEPLTTSKPVDNPRVSERVVSASTEGE